jgi:cation transport ATPase
MILHLPPGIKERGMNSFSFNNAIRFKLVTQQESIGAKIQVFLGVFLGVMLRWLYGILVDVTRGNPWNFGTLSAILARLVIALIATFFVFSGYWEKVKDQPFGMRILNSLVYGFSIDALVGPWTY